MLTHEEVFMSLQKYFENDEHQRNMLRQWNKYTLRGFIKKNPDKSTSEN